MTQVPLPSLVLVPGLMCDHAVWSPMLAHLAVPDAQVTIIDHGKANRLTQMAELALQASPPRFCLVGHSMGARVAMEMLRMAPERIERIALLDTGYAPLEAGDKGTTERAKRYELLAIAREQGMRAMATQWARGMVHPERLQDGALMESILAMFTRKSADIFEAQIEALLARPDATPVLQNMPTPCLLACGRQDSWATVAQHEAMHALAPTAALKIVENAGHMAPMEQPQAMAALLDDWLNN
jgi:pimeloyl-ACP methyl ester carboxylesterase